MIYFVQSASGGPIKIGSTVRMYARRANLRKEHRDPTLHPLGIMDGGEPEEKQLHRRFSSLRIAGEWFRPAPRLLSFIRRFTKPWDGSSLPEHDPSGFGKQIKALRIAAKMTQQQLATVTGLSFCQISQLERCRKHDPRTSTTVALAKALGVSLDELVNGQQNGEAPPQPKKGRKKT